MRIAELPVVPDAAQPARVLVEGGERPVGQVRPVAMLRVERVRLVQRSRVDGGIERLDAARAADHRID